MLLVLMMLLIQLLLLYGRKVYRSQDCWCSVPRP